MRKFLRGMVTLLCALSLVGCSTGADSLAELEELEQLEEIAQESVEENGVAKAGGGAGATAVPPEYKELFDGGSFDENGVWASDKAEYVELIEDLRKTCEENLDGSMIFATDDEVIFAGGWNVTEIDEKTVVSPYTTYEIGELTMSMTAAAILQLVQDGKLKMSDTIEDYFPDLPYGDKITIEHLIYMQPGIPDVLYEPDKFFESAVDAGKDPQQVGEDFKNGAVTDQEMLDYLYKTKFTEEYVGPVAASATNYILLAHILEQVTGQSYEEYMKENIFDVCDMKNSTCAETGNITSVPKPFGEEGYAKYGKAYRGAGDIHSNPCDVLLFDRGLMKGELMDYTHLEFVTEPKDEVSCGWFVMIGHNLNGESMPFTLMQTGGTNGYIAMNYIFRTEDKNYYYIMMTPASGRIQFANKVGRLIFKYMYSLEQ